MLTKIIIIASIILNLTTFNISSRNIDLNTIKGNRIPENLLISNNLPQISKIPKKSNAGTNNDLTNIYAQNYLLLDANSGMTLMSRSSDVEVPIASTAKIMTAVVVLENYNLDEIITVSYQAAAQIGSETNLIEGEQISIKNLLYCLLIKSGNDSAYALAENNQDGLEGFVKKMNKKAENLQMNNTIYSDPAGLNTNTKSTALDLSIIARYAFKNKIFSEIVATPQITVSNASGSINHPLKNSNRLVNDYNYPGAIGVKTGYLPEAGHCLVAAAERENHRLIAVILHTNADTATASALEARKLLDYGFDSYIY